MILGIHSNCAFFKLNDFKITKSAFYLLFLFVFFLFFEASITAAATSLCFILNFLFLPSQNHHISAGVCAAYGAVIIYKIKNLNPKISSIIELNISSEMLPYQEIKDQVFE